MNTDNTKKEHKTKFWIHDPYVLFDNSKLFDLWPLESMNREDKLNAISRLIILLTIVGFLYTREFKMLITGLITLVVIVLVTPIFNHLVRQYP